MASRVQSLEFTETPTYLTDALEICYQQYVKRGGPKAVNISEQMIAEIATQRDEKSWTSETFVKAQEEVYFIMARDVHPRFVNSKLIFKFSAMLGWFSDGECDRKIMFQVVYLQSDERDRLRACLVKINAYSIQEKGYTFVSTI